MKKTLILILTLCILITFTACGTTPTESSTPPETSAATTAATTAAATTAAATTEAATEPAMIEPVTLTCFVGHSWYPIDTFTGIIAEQITKDTGVTLDFTIAADGNQLGVLIASGDLPDLVYTDAQLDKLSDAAISHSYDDLIAQYNIDWPIDPISRGNASRFSADGKIYFVRNHAPAPGEWENAKIGAPMTGSLLYRDDIYKALGSPKFDTLEDFEAILGMVKDKYPDLIPYTFNEHHRFGAFKNFTGLSGLSFLKQDDGSYKYNANTEGYKDLMKMINGWFRKGYMNADNFVLTGDNLNFYKTGKAFSETSCTQNCNKSSHDAMVQVDPSFKSVESKPLGDKYTYATSDTGWSGTFITQNCSNPEAAIKYMQYMFTPYAQKLCQMGREGIDYTLDASGIPVYSAEWQAASADTELFNKTFNPWLYFGGAESVEATGRCASLPNYATEYEPQYKLIRDSYENLPWISASEPVGEMDEKIIYDKIKDMLKPMEAKMIMSASDAEFTKNYDEYLAAMKAAGLDELEAYMSKRIPEVEKNYK